MSRTYRRLKSGIFWAASSYNYLSSFLNGTLKEIPFKKTKVSIHMTYEEMEEFKLRCMNRYYRDSSYGTRCTSYARKQMRKFSRDKLNNNLGRFLRSNDWDNFTDIKYELAENKWNYCY